MVARGIRWMRAGIGLTCFGLAAVGAVLPGLPTTIFLLVGSYFLTRSCPALERRLRNSRLFQPYVAVLDGRRPLSRRARATALAGMWASIAVSGTLLGIAGSGVVTLVLLGLAGIAGTVAIVRFRAGIAG